jgi:hypothetical protein
MTLHVVKLKSSLLKFDGGYHILINRYGYLCHKWSCIYSISRTHNPDLSSFRTYHRDCDKSNTTWGSFARSLVFCVIFCRLLFVLLSLFFLPLAVLLDLRIMINPLVSSILTCDPPNIQMKGIYKTQQKTALNSGWIQFLPKGRQLLHLWLELRLHMCTVLSFSLLNTKLQGLILSPVLSYLYNCVWLKDDNHFVGKSLKLETIMILSVVYKLTLLRYIIKGGNSGMCLS